MTEVDQRAATAAQRISFLAAAAALRTVSDAVHTADEHPAATQPWARTDAGETLAALLLLREVRRPRRLGDTADRGGP